VHDLVIDGEKYQITFHIEKPFASKVRCILLKDRAAIRTQKYEVSINYGVFLIVLCSFALGIMG